MKEITVLSRKGCGGCTATKVVLKKRGIIFKEEKAEEREDLVEKAKEAGMKSYPVIFKKERPIFSGFQYDRLLKLSQ